MQFTKAHLKKERDWFKNWQSGKNLPVTYDNTELFIEDVINENAVKAAIDYCFIDITPRTMKKRDGVKIEFDEIKKSLMCETSVKS